MMIESTKPPLSHQAKQKNVKSGNARGGGRREEEGGRREEGGGRGFVTELEEERGRTSDRH